jgi:MFS family permease
VSALFSTAPATPADIDGRYAWLRMSICLALGTLGGGGMWAIVTVLPEIEAEFSVDRSLASLPYTATMIGFAAGNLLFGRILDRYGTPLPVAIASALFGLGFVLGSMAGSIAMLTVIQGALIGVGSAATFAPLLADISHWFRRRRGIAVAAVACGSYISGVIWPLGMQPLMEAGGWRLAYLVIGLFSVALMLPLSAMLRRRSPSGPARSAGAPVPVRPFPQISAGLTPAQLQALLILAGLSCCIAMSMPQIHIVAYCADLGYGVARGAEMLALMMGAGIVSRLVSGVLADRIGGVRTLLIGSLGQMIGLWLFIPFDGLASLYMVSLIFGLSQGGIVPSYALIVREYLPAEEAGRRVGAVIMATILGMAVGGWMSGLIYDLTGSYGAAFLNGIAWNALNMTVMLFILFRSRPKILAA